MCQVQYNTYIIYIINYVLPNCNIQGSGERMAAACQAIQLAVTRTILLDVV